MRPLSCRILQALVLVAVAVGVALPASAQDFIYFKKKAAAANECAGYLVCENFEDTGAPAGWTGTVDWDYATSPMRGAQMLQNAAETFTSSAISGGSDGWLFFRLTVNDNVTAASALSARKADTSAAFKIGILANVDGIKLRHYADTVNQTYSGVLTAGTPYCIWVHGTRGAGANNSTVNTMIKECSTVCSDATCTRGAWEDSITAITTGTWDSGEGDVVELYSLGAATLTFHLDQVLYRTSEIINVPN